MVVLEPRPPVGGFEQGLKCASQVYEAIAHEEEHGEQRSQDVDVAQQDAALADRHRQQQGSVIGKNISYS